MTIWLLRCTDPDGTEWVAGDYDSRYDAECAMRRIADLEHASGIITRCPAREETTVNDHERITEKHDAEIDTNAKRLIGIVPRHSPPPADPPPFLVVDTYPPIRGPLRTFGPFRTDDDVDAWLATHHARFGTTFIRPFLPTDVGQTYDPSTVEAVIHTGPPLDPETFDALLLESAQRLASSPDFEGPAIILFARTLVEANRRRRSADPIERALQREIDRATVDMEHRLLYGLPLPNAAMRPDDV